MSEFINPFDPNDRNLNWKRMIDFELSCIEVAHSSLRDGRRSAPFQKISRVLGWSKTHENYENKNP